MFFEALLLQLSSIKVKLYIAKLNHIDNNVIKKLGIEVELPNTTNKSLTTLKEIYHG